MVLLVDHLDSTRDMLNLIENYIPEERFDAGVSPLPVHLKKVDRNISLRRAQQGFDPEGRLLFGLCQSVGGTARFGQ